VNQLDIALRMAINVRNKLENEYTRLAPNAPALFYAYTDMNDIIDILVNQGAVNPDKANV
jgi:hypothetical protein